jgi:hypothetical protein
VTTALATQATMMQQEQMQGSEEKQTILICQMVVIMTVMGTKNNHQKNEGVFAVYLSMLAIWVMLSMDILVIQ